MPRRLSRPHRAGKTLIVVMPNEGALVVSNNRASVGFADHHPVGLPPLLALALNLTQALRRSLFAASAGLQSPLPFLTSSRTSSIGTRLGGLAQRSRWAAPLFRGSSAFLGGALLLAHLALLLRYLLPERTLLCAPGLLLGCALLLAQLALLLACLLLVCTLLCAPGPLLGGALLLAHLALLLACLLLVRTLLCAPGPLLGGALLLAHLALLLACLLLVRTLLCAPGPLLGGALLR